MLAVLAWRVVAQTAAANLAASNPEQALQWFADDAVSLVRRAQQELDEPNGNADAARTFAERALLASPLDARAVTLLGLSAEKRGEADAAGKMMRAAGVRSWRDSTAQAWLFNDDVRRGDYRQALPHIDAILRTDLETQAELFPVLASLTVTPAAFAALADFLATDPPWRGWFLQQLSARLANRGRLVELYTALGESPRPPATNELRPYLFRLVADGAIGTARTAWRKTLPPPQRDAVALLYNSDFALPLDGSPFNWVIDPVGGADARIVPAGGGQALRLQFAGARVAFANVKQLLVLPPGKYVFRGRVRAEALETPRGLWWRLFCALPPKADLGATDLVSGTRPWAPFSFAFEVPATGCPAQWLQLELPARVASESAVEGEAWYAGLGIVPLQPQRTP